MSPTGKTVCPCALKASIVYFELNCGFARRNWVGGPHNVNVALQD